MDSKKITKERTRELTIPETMICGFMGGLAQTPLANVIELLKVRLQVQRDNRFTMKGMLREVVRTNGVRALGRGLIPLMWRDSLGYACYFGFCETTLAYITPEHQKKSDLPISTVFLVGMLGGVVYWVPIFPLDTIKSKLHADSLSRPTYRDTYVRLCAHVTKAGGIGDSTEVYFLPYCIVFRRMQRNCRRLSLFLHCWDNFSLYFLYLF